MNLQSEERNGAWVSEALKGREGGSAVPSSGPFRGLQMTTLTFQGNGHTCAIFLLFSAH